MVLGPVIDQVHKVASETGEDQAELEKTGKYKVRGTQVEHWEGRGIEISDRSSRGTCSE